MITKMESRDAMELLRRGAIGRLGCIIDEGPYVVPVNYVFDGDSILVHSLPGRKIAALRANPRACIQVDEVVNEFEWRSAIAYGTYEEVKDPDERDRLLQRILERFPHFTPVESAMSQVEGIPETIIFRIKVESATGVCET